MRPTGILTCLTGGVVVTGVLWWLFGGYGPWLFPGVALLLGALAIPFCSALGGGSAVTPAGPAIGATIATISLAVLLTSAPWPQLASATVWSVVFLIAGVAVALIWRRSAA